MIKNKNKQTNKTIKNKITNSEVKKKKIKPIPDLLILSHWPKLYVYFSHTERKHCCYLKYQLYFSYKSLSFIEETVTQIAHCDLTPKSSLLI